LNRILRFLSDLGLEKNLGYVSIGNIVNTFFGAVLWLIIASRMDASEFGILNYEISIATLLTSIGIMGFDTTLTAYLAKGVTKMTDESIFLVFVSASILSFILFFLYPSLSVILLLVSMLFFTITEAQNLGDHKFKRYMWLMIAQRLISLGTVPIFYFLFGVEATLYGFVLSYFLVSFTIFRRLKYIRISISTIVPIKSYFFHSYILGISKVLPYFFDKLLILPLFGLTIVGYYQFGVQVLSIISIFPVIFYGYLLPRESKKSSIDSLRIYTRFGLICSTILTVVLILSLPAIIVILFPNFTLAITSVQIILLSGVPLTISSIYNSVFMAKGFSWNVVKGTIIFIGIQSISIILLGNFFGLVGLSLATTIASVVQCVYLISIKKDVSPNPQ
jgi:O-antigen/teichoic acid export membrane protein